ncbi:RNA-binding motif [Porites harrisoni]
MWVEEYNNECWLTYHLICCSPTDTDLLFLTHLGQHVSQGVATPSPAPQSSLSRVIFHHLFKSAPATLSKTLSEQQHVGLKAALNVLSHVNKFTVKDNSPTWMLFEYANCRLWAKLAEVVLRSLADSSELLDEAMRYVLQPNGMLGAQSMDNVSVETTSSTVLSRLKDVELLSGKCRVAYFLGRVLSDKQRNSIRVTQYKAQHVRGTMTKGESSELEIPRKIHVMNSEVEKALKLCAVQIIAHSLWLQGFSDKDHMCQADSVSPRWLTDLVGNSGVESLECLVQCKGDVTTILKQGDLLDLCEKVLRRLEPEAQVKAIVQNILMSLLQKASHGKAEEDMKSIISFCRGRRCDHHLDLLPWICTRLQTLNDSKSSVPFEALMDASHGMLEHYKERLARTEVEKRMKKSEEKLSKTNLFLRRLPSGTTDVDLHNLCCGYGSIVSTKAVVDKETNEFKGYGFVNFETPDAAQRAVKALKSKGIQAQMAKQPEKDPTNLYFCRLPKHFDEAELESLLKGYGKVITTRVSRGTYGVSKKVAFARMENKQICKKIIKEMHLKKIQGSVESLVVNFADLRQQSYDSSWPINRRERRPFYGEDSDDDESGHRNPFRTAQAHPFLETAFNLGMMGLEKLGEKPDDPSHDRTQSHLAYTHVSPVKKHLSEFCRLVCYLVNKKWLTGALMVAPGNSSLKTEVSSSGSITVNSSSCQLEGDRSQSASKDSCDKCFLQEFVSSLINNVVNPSWLFDVLQELGGQLCTDILDNGWQSVQETQNVQIKNACQNYPPLNLLLKEDLDAFSKLLLGAKMSHLVAKVTRTRDRRELEPSEVINEFRRGIIVDSNLQEVLQAAKRAFSISDSSGAMFKKLTEEMANKHPILEQLLERVLKDDWTGLNEWAVKKCRRKKGK